MSCFSADIIVIHYDIIFQQILSGNVLITIKIPIIDCFSNKNYTASLKTRKNYLPTNFGTTFRKYIHVLYEVNSHKKFQQNQNIDKW